MQKEEIAGWFRELQLDICRQLEAADGKGKFRADSWERPGGGGGTAMVITDGAVLAKGGVNFSAVHGVLPAAAAKSLHIGTADVDFFATGVSIVQHPVSPMVPIIHMNVRYFELTDGRAWFGGGIDLTPHYVVPQQAAWFHRQLQRVCDHYHPSYYPEFKEWADEYFFIKHRHETRGIGGIFFDRLTATDELTLQDRYHFVQEVGQLFAPAYVQLISQNRGLPYEQRHQDWQLLRRGRYVEFNLVYDRGTRFGLETDGRTESILMSLPPLAAWEYDYHPEAGTAEAETLQYLKKGIDWVNLPA